jgi:hypothetical protein
VAELTAMRAGWRKHTLDTLNGFQKRAERAEDRVKELEFELKAERDENECDACGGSGGVKCMCNGTGRMSEAARYLRERLVKSTSLLEKADKVGREMLLGYGAMLANLTSTQARCTELFLENRELRERKT